MAQLNSSGNIVETGAAQESKVHGINESLAHARDTFPSLSSEIETSFTAGSSWNDLLTAANPYGTVGPLTNEDESPPMPSVQDYNFVLGAGNYFGHSTNPIITGINPVSASILGWNVNNGSGDEFIPSIDYYFYGTSGHNATLAFQN